MSAMLTMAEEQLNDFIDECMDNGYFKFRMDW
jgi:hypothetical protein